MPSLMILGGYSSVFNIPVEEIKNNLSIEHLLSRPKATFLSEKKILPILLKKTTSYDSEEEDC